MWMDVIDLRDFYATSLGQTARRVIRRRIRTLWHDVHGLSVLGLGYATPYLGPFRSEAERTLALMPAPLGVLHWPSGNGTGEGAANLTSLVDEMALPLPDLSMDRVLLVHCVEYTEHLRPLMREAWRVLSPSGRLLVVVPNRNGMWARFERTPFGQGRPYSPYQLSHLLRETLFTPEQSTGALFVPPTRWRLIMAWAPALEKVGQRWFPTFSGVVMVEAVKRIYATPPGAPERRRRRLAFPVPRPARRPLAGGPAGSGRGASRQLDDD